MVSTRCYGPWLFVESDLGDILCIYCVPSMAVYFSSISTILGGPGGPMGCRGALCRNCSRSVNEFLREAKLPRRCFAQCEKYDDGTDFKKEQT